MMAYLKHKKKLLEKHWYGDKWEYEYIQVDVIGEQEHELSNSISKTYLIKFDDGDIVEADESEVFFTR